MLLVVNNIKVNKVKTEKTRMGYPINLVSLSLLTDYIHDFFTKGSTMRSFYVGYEKKCIMKWGMEPKQVISWNMWHSACVEFLNNILTIDDKKCFTCINCGPRPKVMVVDGIAMGLQISELKKHIEKMNFQAPYKSNTILEGSKFEDRNFIRKGLKKHAIYFHFVDKAYLEILRPLNGTKVKCWRKKIQKLTFSQETKSGIYFIIL